MPSKTKVLPLALVLPQSLKISSLAFLNKIIFLLNSLFSAIHQEVY